MPGHASRERLISLPAHLKLDRDLALTRLARNQDHIRRSCLTSDHIPPDQHQEFGATWP
jgi:hypothetical protein